MPTEAVRKISRSLKLIGRGSPCSIASAKPAMRLASFSDIRMRPNWSPESRASVSCGFSSRPAGAPASAGSKSPTAMPTESLTCLKRSRSITITVGRMSALALPKASTASSRSRNSSRFGSPVRWSCTASWSRRSADTLASVTSVSVPTRRTTSPSEPTTGRAFMVNHRSGRRDRAGGSPAPAGRGAARARCRARRGSGRGRADGAPRAIATQGPPGCRA